jgi:SAM-dependent methyltransferase
MRNLTTATGAASVGLLGDTPSRNYSNKLSRFNLFAEPELRRLISSVGLRSGMRVLDAGCGTGEALQWLLDEVKPLGKVLGIDLARAHVEAARRWAGTHIEVAEADLSSGPVAPGSLDFIWCVNTVNHLRDPIQGVGRLASLLRPGGRIALGQSSLMADMYFAWDARLEHVVDEAVRRYYRERYSLSDRDLTSTRALVGVLRAAQLKNVSVRTVLIERVSPVNSATESYLVEAIFKSTWGERLRPYLTDGDYADLVRVCDPNSRHFALRRPDFHFLQSFTLATGGV